MNNEKYFIRFRGKITGPFSIKQLKELRARGQLSTFHEVSEDRTNWVLASSLADVFSNGKPVQSKGMATASNSIPSDTNGQSNGIPVSICPPQPPPPPFHHSPKVPRKVAIIYWVLLAVFPLCLGGGGFFILNDTWERDRIRVEQQSRLDKEASDRTKREREDREQREKLERERPPGFRDCAVCRSTGKERIQCETCGGRGRIDCNEEYGHNTWGIWGPKRFIKDGSCIGGRIMINGADRGPCPACNARGYHDCGNCRGTREVEKVCSKCAGKGQIKNEP